MSETHVLRARSLESAGFAHGFSTRIGGSSEGPYHSLNLGRSVGDVPDRVRDNHQRLARTVGYAVDRLYDASQVHGAAVISVMPEDKPDEVRGRKADALVAREVGCAVGVRTADCVPVLLADRNSGAVAAVHAGWRGVVAGVVGEAIVALRAREPSALVAAIGPSIGPCCFEVGADVAAGLAEAGGDGIVLRRGGDKPHVDLWRAVAHQLRRAGVTSVETLSECTVCSRERFYSYRRDGAASGRMLSVIVAGPRATS